MTAKTVRDQARERLEQRARRQAQKESRADEVIRYVRRTYLINATDVIVEAAFDTVVRGLDTFHVIVSIVDADGVLNAKHPYQVDHSVGVQREQVSIAVERLYLDDEPTQAWATRGGEREFDDIIDAILDATGWTLEDVS